jgi:hypothetical protein
MNFIKPENSNLTFGAGKNPNTGSLDVTMSYREDIPGRVFAVSVWEVSDEELAEIIRTKRIYLSTMGAGMIPVSILAFDPFKHYGYYPGEMVEATNELGMLIKQVVDPRDEEQFAKWMDMLAEELKTNEFFKTHDQRPETHAPREVYKHMYHHGLMVSDVAEKLKIHLEHIISKQN